MVWCIRVVASILQAFIIRPRRKWCLHTRAAPWIFKNLNPFGLEHRAAEFVIFFIPMVLFDVAGTVILARLYPEDDYSVAALFGVFTTGVIWHMKNYYLFLRTGVVASADPAFVRHDERDCYAGLLADATPGFLGRRRHNFTFTGPLNRVSYLYLNPFGAPPRAAEAFVYINFSAMVLVLWWICLAAYTDYSTPWHKMFWPLNGWIILVWLINLYFLDLPEHVWTPRGHSRKNALVPEWVREYWEKSA